MSKIIVKYLQKSNISLIYIFLIAVIFAIYGDSIYYGYISEDFTLVNMTFSHLLNNLINGPHFRPLWYFSYIVTNYFVQSSIFDHLINLSLYSVAVILAYRYANLHIDKVKSFFVVLIWITLPWTVSPVTYISARTDLIMYIFTFLSLLSFSKGHVIRAALFITLSFLSKVVTMFLPLYFIYKGVKDKNRSVIILNVIIFAIFFALALHGYLNNITQEHLKNIGLFFKVLNYSFHLVDSTVTQFIPIPFVVSLPHLFIYVASFIFAIKSFTFKPYFTNELTDTIILAALLMLPTAIHGALRIVSLESFFILLTLSTLLKVKNKKYFSIFLFLYMLFNLYAIIEVKKNFKTLEYNLENRHLSHVPEFYNNNYYQNKRAFFVKIVRKIKNQEPLK